LVEARLAPDGLSPVAARIPPGHRAVAVPTAAGGFATEAPPVEVGDRVDVLATFDVLEPDAPPTAPVARDALVIEVADSRISLAVEADDAAPVAFALARGTVTLALVGAPGP
ncbi:MAG TPA: RcpC/CpaB family pilus assembly protein, partial [Acidimicrobiales bacterium]|nr:RcpC/CpaB family pilus assembly protein [Acidimicrobiales bacterium]